MIAFLAAAGLATQGDAATDTARIPAVMLGAWAHGSCAAIGNRLLITRSKAKLGAGQAADIVYRADEQGPGHGAIHWTQQYVVDNFVYDSTLDAIVHNSQGFGMPGQVVYRRCPPEYQPRE